MADIEIVKRHSLPMAAARSLVQKAADDLAKEFDLESEWAGDTLNFSRSGVQGQMHVTASEIRLEVTLGFLMKMFKGRFVDTIERRFDTLLAAAHAKGRPTQRKAASGKTAAKPKSGTRKG